MKPSRTEFLACPLPHEPDGVVQMAHGGGGRKTAALIERMFLPALGNVALDRLADGATFAIGRERLAMTTDTFVVQPIFFPGGDIGSLAIHGTANDLAMCGARPVGFSVGLVLEEGLPMVDLQRVISSLAAASAFLGAPVLTGDTKVVERQRGDGLLLNTTGIGRVLDGIDVAPDRARPGDVVLLSGPVGDHGIAVMAARQGIEFATELKSDSAPVWPLVEPLLLAVPEVHVLRDPTRGGLATALHEIATAAGVGIRIEEARIPVRPEVQAACELLGFDPLFVACEGRFVALVPAGSADRALAVLREQPGGEAATAIGEVVEGDTSRLVLQTRFGSHRRLEPLSGEPLPRIC